MVMSKQTQTKLETRLTKLEKENQRKEKENQRLKAKQAKENSRLEKENLRFKTMLAETNLRFKTMLAETNLRFKTMLAETNLRFKTMLAETNLRFKTMLAETNLRFKTMLAETNLRFKTMLAKEDSLWNTELGQKRHSSVLPTRLLHTHEMLEYIISDEKMIKALTRNIKEIFDNTLGDLPQIIKKSNDSPHFRDDQNRKEESGNQYKLYIRHFLLMIQVRKAQDWGQESLGAFFGIDQRYVVRLSGKIF